MSSGMIATSLGTGRKIFKKVYVVESAKVPNQWRDIVGFVDNTNETSVLHKQMKGFGPAEETGDGEEVKWDQITPIRSRETRPVLFTKGVRYSKLMQFTNQYKEILSIQPAWVRSFMHKKNQYVANLDVLGFTSTTMGMNSETLYSTSHDMGGLTFANKPTVAIAYSPLAHQQSMIELRKQKSARNLPQPPSGKILYKFPVALEAKATEVINALRIAYTNDNTPNDFIRNRSEMMVCDYYTSDTAWFARMMDNAEHGLGFLAQMPYDVEQLARGDDLMDKWVGSESYEVFWYDAHGSWGTEGA